MKSIMQEASSIVKAIETAWIKAGKPQEFSVKIFEEPQKNFFGMTTKSAKIGIFFDHEVGPKKYTKPRPESTQVFKQEPRKPIVKKEQQPQQLPQQPIEEPQKRIMWNDEMIIMAQKWLKDSLQAMDKGDVGFTTDVNNYYLRFTFDRPVLETDERERQLFRSFSFLMLQALKKQLKRPLRGFKVVLTRGS
ncbi:MAG: hypothetical protein WDZ41_00190 [Candidatus Babeliales bacterium]